MPEPAYDPARDLATVLHAAMRQGFWSPAARGAIERLRHRLSAGAGRLAALENVAYLASLPPEAPRHLEEAAGCDSTVPAFLHDHDEQCLPG